jgi:hypothetical protein
MKFFMYSSVSWLWAAVAVLIGFYIGSHSAEAQAYPRGYSALAVSPQNVSIILDSGDVCWRTEALERRPSDL